MQYDDFECLHLAVIHENLSQLRLLLKSGVISVNATDNEGTTALILASVNNNIECVSELIKYGADPNLSRISGTTPLFFACQSGHTSIVRFLLLSGSLANPKTLHDDATPLHVCAQNGHFESCQLLLEHRAYIIHNNIEGANFADINARISDGATPIFLAAQNNHIPILQALINAGAKVDISRKDLATPLYIASQLGHSRIIKLLICAGANIDASREDGTSPLYKACQKGHLNVVQLLLAAGASVNLCGNGDTPLHAAVLFGRTRITHLLLLRGADPNLINKDGISSLQLAFDAKFFELGVVLKHFSGSVTLSSYQKSFNMIKYSKNSRVTAPIVHQKFRNNNRSWAYQTKRIDENSLVPGRHITGVSLTEPVMISSSVHPCYSNDEGQRDAFVHAIEYVKDNDYENLDLNEENDLISRIKCSNLADDCPIFASKSQEEIKKVLPIQFSYDSSVNEFCKEGINCKTQRINDRSLFYDAPNSAPSIVKTAPWSHEQFDTFMPPSPPDTDQELENTKQLEQNSDLKNPSTMVKTATNDASRCKSIFNINTLPTVYGTKKFLRAKFITSSIDNCKNIDRSCPILLRVHPKALLKEVLIEYVKELSDRHGYSNGFTVGSCIGSLSEINMRFAYSKFHKNEPTKFLDSHYEILSMHGTITADGKSHLHICLSDENGSVIGGHFLKGGKIFTTAEIMLIPSPIKLTRDYDSETEFNELMFENESI